MVGKLNDTENFGNEEKQDETVSIRRMKSAKRHLGKSLLRHCSKKLCGERGHLASAEEMLLRSHHRPEIAQFL